MCRPVRAIAAVSCLLLSGCSAGHVADTVDARPMDASVLPDGPIDAGSDLGQGDARTTDAGQGACSAAYANAVLSDSPQAYYPMNETSGTVMANHAPGQLNGTYGPGVTLGQTGLVPSASDPSPHFPGSLYSPNNIALVPPSSALQASATFSAEMTFEEDAANAGTVGDGYVDVVSFAWGLQVTPTNTVKLWMPTSNQNVELTGATSITPGQAHHAVATYDGMTARLYLDGQLEASAAASGSLSYAGSAGAAGLSIGASPGTPTRAVLEGRVAHVSTYDTALSSGAVQAHWHATGLDGSGHCNSSGLDAGTDSAGTPVNGACGAANGTMGGTAPTSELCSTGTASALSGSGPWSWTCAGSNGGTTVSCDTAPQAPTPALYPFPRLGLQTGTGTQTYTSPEIAQLSQYSYVQLGGNFPQWVSVQAASGGPPTRDGVVNALHNQTHTGKNAVTPLVFQYENVADLASSPSNSSFPEWYTAVTDNNWFCYQEHASGARCVNAWDQSDFVHDDAHVVGADSSTGLYPYGLATLLTYQRYYSGEGSAGAAMASPHLDGYYFDVFSQYNLWAGGSPADFLRNGTGSSAPNAPISTAATILGKVDYPDELTSLNPHILSAANAGFGYSFASSGGMGMAQPDALSGKLDAAMDQFMFGSVDGGAYFALNFESFAGAMSWYESTETNLKPGGMALETGIVDSTDYQMLRYSISFILMRNGWYIAGVGGSGCMDFVNPGDPTTYPVFDEFWGGTLNLGGYLGTAAATPRGAEQDDAWLQGVWRRDFASGIALANPVGNGTQTVALGGTYYHLRGSQAPSVNNGMAVTSVTIPAGDGLILLNTMPP